MHLFNIDVSRTTREICGITRRNTPRTPLKNYMTFMGGEYNEQKQYGKCVNNDLERYYLFADSVQDAYRKFQSF